LTGDYHPIWTGRRALGWVCRPTFCFVAGVDVMGGIAESVGVSEDNNTRNVLAQPLLKEFELLNLLNPS